MTKMTQRLLTTLAVFITVSASCVFASASDPRTPDNGYLVNGKLLPEMIAVHREHRVVKDETLV